ncbi:MAG: CinA family protein [Clostridiales bacterium]|jgi:nicotinamide-nucleotide amidase|nr:CinA family protein [Clostridiales bacterium]
MPNEDIVLRLFALCREKNIMLSVCESLTGGLVIDSLISEAGASQFVYEGVVAYSNLSKIRRLSVKEETLEKFGAVSAETALEMAEGLFRSGVGAVRATLSTADGIRAVGTTRLTADSARAVGATLSTTGVAGPDGGSAEKPVGLTYIGVCVDGRTDAHKFIFGGGRAEIREQAARKALELLESAVRGSDTNVIVGSSDSPQVDNKYE